MREGCEADYDNAPACSYFQHLHTSASAQTGVRERERERALVWLSLGLGRVRDGVTGLHLDAAPEVASAGSAGSANWTGSHCLCALACLPRGL